MFNYDIHNFSYDIEICNCAIPMWRLNMLFGPWHDAITFDYFAFAMCWFVTVPWRSAIILCYFAVAFSYSSISTLGKAVLLLWFVIFIACVSLWCFVKVTCSSRFFKMDTVNPSVVNWRANDRNWLTPFAIIWKLSKQNIISKITLFPQHHDYIKHSKR